MVLIWIRIDISCEKLIQSLFKLYLLRNTKGSQKKKNKSYKIRITNSKSKPIYRSFIWSMSLYSEKAKVKIS